MDKKRKAERRVYERRTCVIPVAQERRSGFERRQILRREDDRADRRRRGFWRYQNQQRITKDMQARQKRIRERRPYSLLRILAARQKALDLVYKNANQADCNRNRLAREIALIKNITVTGAPQHILSTWNVPQRIKRAARQAENRNKYNS